MGLARQEQLPGTHPATRGKAAPGRAALVRNGAVIAQTPCRTSGELRPDARKASGPSSLVLVTALTGRQLFTRLLIIFLCKALHLCLVQHDGAFAILSPRLPSCLPLQPEKGVTDQPDGSERGTPLPKRKKARFRHGGRPQKAYLAPAQASWPAGGGRGVNGSRQLSLSSKQQRLRRSARD